MNIDKLAITDKISLEFDLSSCLLLKYGPKNCRKLYARVCLWLLRAWVRIPFAAIFADLPRSWFKLMTFRLLFLRRKMWEN